VFDLVNEFVPGSNLLWVYVNGIKQTLGVSYIESSDYQVTFLTPLTSGSDTTEFKLSTLDSGTAISGKSGVSGYSGQNPGPSGVSGYSGTGVQDPLTIGAITVGNLTVTATATIHNLVVTHNNIPGQSDSIYQPWWGGTIMSGNIHFQTNSGGTGDQEWCQMQNQNAQIDFKVSLSAGTYTFKMLHTTDSDFADCTIYIDSVSVGTISSAGATAWLVLTSITGIVVTDGMHTLSVKMDLKGAEDSWNFYWHAFNMWRTA
jgi:hypothetical protein